VRECGQASKMEFPLGYTPRLFRWGYDFFGGMNFRGQNFRAQARELDHWSFFIQQNSIFTLSVRRGRKFEQIRPNINRICSNFMLYTEIFFKIFKSNFRGGSPQTFPLGYDFWGGGIPPRSIILEVWWCVCERETVCVTLCV